MLSLAAEMAAGAACPDHPGTRPQSNVIAQQSEADDHLCDEFMDSKNQRAATRLRGNRCL
jgi:hypothetical protein